MVLLKCACNVFESILNQLTLTLTDIPCYNVQIQCLSAGCVDSLFVCCPFVAVAVKQAQGFTSVRVQMQAMVAKSFVRLLASFLALAVTNILNCQNLFPY